METKETTITVSQNTRRELMIVKQDLGFKNIDELLTFMIKQLRRNKKCQK